MKEYQLRQGLCKTIAFSFCVCASVAGLFSCDSDRLNGGGSIGKLSLNLAADTANIKGGTLSTKAVNVLADFEDVDNYTVQIFQGSDTLKSALYKDFPGELEIKEGAYTLRASKGANLPAAFDNPYFEGSTDFVVKKDMKTPLEVTCTMANARIYAEYSEDFLKAYSDYSVSLKTSSMDDVFTISKGETRGAYLQVAKEGTPLSIAITLMRENWEKPEVYTVTDPTITLKPKESVLLKFSTDGKTGDGLDLSIELDDSMEEADLEFGIPDFMWKPFTDLRIWACGFENNIPVEMNVTNGYPSDSCTIKAEVPGRIKECWVVRLEDGEKIDSVDIATAEGLNTAENVWGLNAVSSPIAGVKGLELDLKGAFNKMYASDRDKTYGFSVYVNDALNVMHTSDVITASVNLKAAKEPAVGIFELAIPSKHSLEKDTAIAVLAEAGIKALTLKVSKDGSMQNQYNLLANNLPEGIYYDTQKHKVVFKKEYSSKLESKETEASTYSYELSVTDNLNKTVTKTSILTVTPVFTIVVPEGDVWTNRATIQVVENVTYSKSYQLKVGDQWQDYSDATITGLKPNTTYTVRALVNNWATTETTFTTEAALQVPNAGFEEWSIAPDANNNSEEGAKNEIKAGGNTEKPYRYWEVWQPWSSIKESVGWNTLNSKTTSDGGIKNGYVTFLNAVKDATYEWARYSANSGTIRTNGNSGNYAALVRTVGWGSGSSAPGKLFDGVMKRQDPGYLYLGDYTETPESSWTGLPFVSRPNSMSFYYKYIRAKGKKQSSDKFSVKVVVQHRNGNEVTTLGEGSFIGGGDHDVSSYTKEMVEIKYINYTLKATNLYIMFKSGSVTEYKYFSVPSSYNLSNGEYIGSQLYIDDVELIYE